VKRLTLVAGTQSTASVLGSQLGEYLEGRAVISTLWIDGSDPETIARGINGAGDLLLLSSGLVCDELTAAGFLDPGVDLLVARRTVDCDGLDRIVALPPGARVLFVNDRLETARECVESLVTLGLDAVSWLPWWPGAEVPSADYRVAVVAGESGLVPPGMTEVIDIGVRVLEYGTLAEIYARLGLPPAEIGTFSRRYLAKIASLARRLARSTEEARRLSGHLASVIDNLRHGILVYDAVGRVSVCNEEARSLLNLRPGDYSNAALAGIVRNRELLDFLECRCGEETGVFKLPEGVVMARRFDLGEGGHTVATLRDERDAAAEASRLTREYRRRGHVAKWGMDDIVGESEALRRAKRIAARLAPTDLSILINGESGTGKELFASAIHAASARAAGPFLAVDLGALSDDLIESELFGYEEGAFTGAKKGGKAGLFEQADGGTLFLDEIGNISQKVQKRLLRVLQEKEIMRVGGSDIKRVDVRVIAASNEDLLDRASRGEFREDLYFRLKMGWLRIPPLRERVEDIALLVDRFLALEGARDVRVDPTVLRALAARDWPGNVRELRNALTYMLAVREGEGISPGDLPEGGYFAETAALSVRASPREAVYTAFSEATVLESASFSSPALDAEDRFILKAVAELEAEGRHAGREAVSAICFARGLTLGPGSVRSRFDRLSTLGYLVSSRGRGGTRLTADGRRLFLNTRT